ncbi:autotransporter domain-containing protein [Simkania sp.]|uniref:autotransporter family protein n=1 Tax=Simkania sp. TaxID=34094 RepID=UPI003B52FD8F
MPYKYLVPIFLATSCILNGVEVYNATDLNNAIIAANATPQGDPNIKFGSSIDFFQFVQPLLQPLNTDGVLNSVNNSITIDGNGKTLRATPGTHRGFFARTSSGTVIIKDLTISNAVAKGGDGSNGGGGGLGAGGGLFLNKDSKVILENVSFENCRAIGGAGSKGDTYDSSVNNGGIGGGGGGGLGGNGGTGGLSGPGSGGSGGGTGGGGGGGGGFSGDGGNASKGGAGGGGGFNGNGGNSTNTGGAGGGGGGYNGGNTQARSGAGGAGDGGDGGSGFGGGGSGYVSTANSSADGGKGGFGGGGGGSGAGLFNGQGTGGEGGFGGGGGGAGSTNTKATNSGGGGTGGAGGFGGGGGFAGYGGERGQSGVGGDGGFGAGGGGSLINSPSAGGFGGGKGLFINNTTGSGGGGGAMGADIFIENRAKLTIQTGISFSGSQITAGRGTTGTEENNGQALGRNIFMMSEGSITVKNLTRRSIVPHPIESDYGAGTGDINGGGLSLADGNSATFVIVGANTYTGSTTIESGTLNLNGSVITPVILAAPLTSPGGTFTGRASLLPYSGILGTGDLTVQKGTVRPGDIIFGRIQVGNNLLFTGGRFLTEVDSINNARRIDVNGTATLAGNITVDRAIGNFLEGQVIPVINAGARVFGTFGSENIIKGADGLPLFSVQYASNAVELLVLRNYVFVRPIVDPGNPRHVAKYILDQLPIDPNSDFGLVVRSLGVLSDKELNKTLNMMHQGVFGLFEFMNLTTNAQIMQMFNQLRFRLSVEEGAKPLSHLTASTKPFYPNTPLRRGCGRDVSRHHHVYFQPFGTWNSQSQKGELRGANYESAGFLTGYDYLFDHFYVGTGGGYAYTNFRWDGSAGKGHIHQVYGGLHGIYFNRYFSAILGSMVGGNFYETDRNIISSAPNHPNGALNRTAHSNNNGIQWTNQLGFVGDFSSFSVPLQIFANLDHFYLHNGSFNETGANSINLRVNSKTSNALRSELGLSSSYTLHVSDGCWTPYARISWVNKTLLSSSSYRGGFRGQVGTFSASATSKGTNQWSVGTGIEFANMHGFSLLLNSRAEINGKMKNYSADMHMEYAF